MYCDHFYPPSSEPAPLLGLRVRILQIIKLESPYVAAGGETSLPTRKLQG
jgi:hypothetical protein